MFRFPQILLTSHIAEMQDGSADTLVIEPGADKHGRIGEVEYATGKLNTAPVCTSMEEITGFYPRNRREWRQWLVENHRSAKNVWLVVANATGDAPGVRYEDAVEEAISFGWIDSTARARDGKTHLQRFSRRNPKSRWSRSNRERAEKMIAAGLMTGAGMESIRIAKESGTWLALESVQENEVPPDLSEALDRNPAARKNFKAFPPSSKRIILEWIRNAKKDDTRMKRIDETVRMAAENLRAGHYRQ